MKLDVEQTVDKDIKLGLIEDVAYPVIKQKINQLIKDEIASIRSKYKLPEPVHPDWYFSEETIRSIVVDVLEGITPKDALERTIGKPLAIDKSVLITSEFINVAKSRRHNSTLSVLTSLRNHSVTQALSNHNYWKKHMLEYYSLGKFYDCLTKIQTARKQTKTNEANRLATIKLKTAEKTIKTLTTTNELLTKQLQPKKAFNCKCWHEEAIRLKYEEKLTPTQIFRRLNDPTLNAIKSYLSKNKLK
ncbi:hypothetical protein Shal_1795 [Shewanella halifaxensis HAW-EB4]|uniref:Uncharacterized protein n=1 Tax=Shewanella halifaxensis (strain HAW-EB4) TaxID=458817 RepID=B0TQW5_SHEHH|nr:hypothetical protein Shal_1795 [Shewanella halifaxensis HAW-EB4]